jgi:small subunit ribosomal protein S6
LFILDANQYGRDPNKISGQIPQMIEQASGEIMVSRLWEERRLAYPIKGHRKGTYWLTYFRIDGTRLPEIQRQCEMNDTILRSLMLKVDPRIVDALVAHAQEAPIRASTEDEAEDGEKSEKSETPEGEKQPAVAAEAEGGE